MVQKMAGNLTRRNFAKQASWLLAGVPAASLLRIAKAADASSAIVETSAGKVRGTTVDGVNIFKGIPYGGTTAGKNRFMPPTKPIAWTGVRDLSPMDPALRKSAPTRAVRPDLPARAKTAWC
jgi:para-nitrobenzyl esterase